MAVVDYFGNAVAVSRTPTKFVTVASVIDGTATGLGGSEQFNPGIGATTMIGGSGDDTYYSVTAKTKIVEQPGGGVDTVVASSDLVMPDNVENMTVQYARAGVVGNDLANYIVDKLANQSIDGGKGNDVLTGGGGGDSFVFDAQSGYDLITNFHAGSTGTFDTVRLAGYSQFKSFGDVQAALSQVGNDTVLKLDATDAIKFANTKVGDFTASNFLTTIDTSKMTMTFDEEFNGPLDAASGDHAAKWRTDYGFGGDPNGVLARTFKATGETEIEVDPLMTGTGSTAVGINPFSVSNGVLDIHAAPTPTGLVDQLYGYKITSGAINTRSSFTQTYGYFEARMKLPDGQGMWPAFWLYSAGTNRSELDVMEQRGSATAGTWTGTTHDYSTGKDTPNFGVFFTPDMTSQYHTYGVLWTAETVTWYLDGVAVRSIPTPTDMHGPMYMIAGLSTDQTVSSDFKGADLQIDYIRAYSLGDAPAAVTAQAQLAAQTQTSSVSTVTGGTGNDYLNDAGGATSLVGGTGNDTYFVSKATTKVVENAGEGVDTVKASIDYTLPANVENLTLTGNAHVGTGNELNNVLTANDLGDTLYGGAGNDQLIGGKGVDTLIGGTGNDVYVVNNSATKIIENAGEGWDAITANVDYVAPANIEQMTLAGTATHGTANDQGMILIGNDLGDTLTGGAGPDIIKGGKGDDIINGGGGNDHLTGGGGHDTFVFGTGFGRDVITDFVIGEDKIDWSAVKATGAVPVLKDVGGNAVATFGSESITFTGLKAADLTAADVFGLKTPAATTVATPDPVTTTTTTPVVSPTPVSSTTTTTTPTTTSSATVTSVPVTTPVTTPVSSSGGSTATTSVGKTMVGTAGNDSFYVTSKADVVKEAVSGGTDTITSAVDYTLPQNVENLFLTGSAITGTGNDDKNVILGNALDNTLYGKGGDDVLSGGAGADTMVGGTGNDTYVVDNAGDKVIENAGEGNDSVQSSIDYTLTANVENLTLTGNAHVGTGNELDNVLTANDLGDTLSGGAGNDRLISGKGVDTLIGGTGNDNYVVNNTKDIVVEKAGEGNDTIFSSVDYTAPANIEQLTLTGTATKAVANDQGMILVANDLGNTLIGGKGNDFLYGGKGNDTLTGGGGKDVFVFKLGFGKDVITDFNVNDDTVNWSALKQAGVTPVLKDVGGNAVATFGSDTITFLGVHAADLTSHHVFG